MPVRYQNILLLLLLFITSCDVNLATWVCIYVRFNTTKIVISSPIGFWKSWAWNQILAKKRNTFSDENCRIWGERNPLEYQESILHHKKLTAWCELLLGQTFSEIRVTRHDKEWAASWARIARCEPWATWLYSIASIIRAHVLYLNWRFLKITSRYTEYYISDYV